MALTTDACRVEVAWGTTTALSTAPAWEDMSSSVALEQGITWNRGRPDGQSQVSAGQLAFALRNDTGTYTPGLISSSRYPNVVLGRRARVTVRPPTAGAANMLSAEDASFEGGTTGAWAAGGSVHPTLTNDASHPQVGTKGMLVTWGTGGSFPQAAINVSGFVIGRTYTASCYVYVPTGSPNVLLVIAGATAGVQTAVKNSLVRISVTFTATATTHGLQLWPGSAPTTGQQCWVDAVQVDEGTSVVTFTTTPPSSVITPRFDGIIDSLVVGMTSTGAVTFVGASDVLKQLGDNRPLRSILSEEILNDEPLCYWPLGDPSGATAAGDVSGGVSVPVLTPTQRGAGGALTFGTGTGPAFDGATAAVLAPASTVNGLYLTAAASLSPPFGMTMGCFVNTATAVAQGLIKISDPYGTHLTLEVTAAGKLLGALFDAASATTVGTVTSSSNVTGGTKHIAVTVGLVGTAATLTLWLDGVSAGIATWTQSSGLLYGWSVINVGGSATDPLLTGTVSHCYVAPTALSSSRISEQRNAGLTGFVGELSGTRMARLLRLAGLPSALVNCEAGLSTMAQQSTAGQGPLTAAQDVVNAERGVIFAAGDGRATFHSRSHRYNAAATATLDAVNDLGSPELSSTLNDQQLINDVSGTRPSGASQRAVNADSVNANGTFATSLSMLVDSDGLAQQLLQSMANTYSVPQPRAPELVLDLLTVADTTVTAALALDVGARADVVNLPSQAPSSTLSLFTEGLKESVMPKSWDLTVSTSPATYTAAWVLDSATYSQLDSTTILAL